MCQFKSLKSFLLLVASLAASMAHADSPQPSAPPATYPTLNFQLVDTQTGLSRGTYGSLDACMQAAASLNSSDGTSTVCNSFSTTTAQPTAPWSKIAGEGAYFSLDTAQVVRYGTADYWVQRTVSGSVQCSNDFFGADPAYGVVKECDLSVAPTATTSSAPAPVFSLPTVNVAAIPPPQPGYSTDRVSPTDEVVPDSDIGAFRTTCTFSHMAFDDPIVYPGQPGKSHLHAFFGNTGTNANSTADSLANSGDSTCRGGTINRTGYWVPAMIDTKDGTPILPLSSNVYYKTGYNGVKSADVHPFPPGLRMVAGDSTATTPWAGTGRFNCDLADGTNSGNAGSIPDCKPLTGLLMTVDFPQCWDGVNLDSPDHKSHMAYANSSYILAPTDGSTPQWWQTVSPTIGCPPTHPVALPLITFLVWYQTPATAHDVLRWRLSSDKYDPSRPGGYSIHADWFYGWKSDIVNTWVQHCLQAKKDCHSHLLGDGRQMY